MYTILFVSVHIEESPKSVPLGAAMLASNIRRCGDINTKLLDLYLTDSMDDCIRKIHEANADFIGFSLYVWNRPFVFNIIENLKNDKDYTIILGGSEATADFDNFNNDPLIDYVIKGEGEEKIVSLLDKLTEQNSPEKSDCIDLNSLPSPYLDGTLNLKDYKGALWELSRGCPFKCDFCFESRGEHGIRRFPIDRIIEELKLFNENNVSEIFVLDPTFNYNRKEAKELLKLFIEYAPDIHYSIEIRAEFIDEELAYLFSQINCSLQIGLQSCDQNVLKNINRTIDIEVFTDNILLLHEHGVVYGFDLIYGLPHDTLKGFLTSIDYALSLVPNHLDIFPLSVLPGTKLFETADGFGLTFEKENPYRVIESKEFSRDDLKEADYIAKACDIFYSQGKAVPWFSIIVNSLDINPSQFFKEFSNYLIEKEQSLEDIKGDSIVNIQRDFLEDVFVKKGKIKEGIIASDIAAYFGYTAFLMEEENVKEGDNEFFLNPDSFFVTFNHNPYEILNLINEGIIDLYDLSDILNEDLQNYIFYVADNEIIEKELSDEKDNYLKNFKGSFDKDNPFFIQCLEENIIWREK
ncbi:MAG: DUF4080 domain-containing protein [Deltaproteobacteria bacterium]|nr:DUF4080 domain-containing protein [Deltaproteobacteria bacterium]